MCGPAARWGPRPKGVLLCLFFCFLFYCVLFCVLDNFCWFFDILFLHVSFFCVFVFYFIARPTNRPTPDRPTAVRPCLVREAYAVRIKCYYLFRENEDVTMPSSFLFRENENVTMPSAFLFRESGEVAMTSTFLFRGNEEVAILPPYTVLYIPPIYPCGWTVMCGPAARWGPRPNGVLLCVFCCFIVFCFAYTPYIMAARSR